LLELLTRLPELPDHRPIQAYLVDLAGDIKIVRWIRVRHVHDLAGARRDANRLGVTDILDLGLERPIAVEYLDALVAAVHRVDVSLRVDGDAVDAGEVPRAVAALPP